ncbi:chitinase [Rhizoctonia solani]|uniref:Chitinase n=1 Tax=Rhizoctonia solani TaxID=456999 RepID=A0A8H8T1B8_9AGAM|nr:chitinase [Rhizoctonia solani]QRW26291.1 chitinase [Rhizoctonia solani]
MLRSIPTSCPRGLQDSHCESGDGCGTLASKCGISAADFTKYNSKLDCSKLAPGQWVCCSSGTLPSRLVITRIPPCSIDPHRMRIQPTFSECGWVLLCDDVVDGTTCTGVSATYDITMDEINKWNQKTWRWTGCGGLQPGMRICGSTGTPPLPKTNSCRPLNFSSELLVLTGAGLAIPWGYCGITEDFCTVNKTGAPGTGCQSNCKLLSEFDNVGKATANPGRNIIGYYSNWAATVAVMVSPTLFSRLSVHSDDDELIKELQGLKKQNPNLKTMWAVGGWAFNDPPYQDIFSTMARTSSSRAAFIKNVLINCRHTALMVLILIGNTLALSAEVSKRTARTSSAYEGAASRHQGIWQTSRGQLHAPASYWYVPPTIPDQGLQEYTDWINLMTYDIHGSWDIKFNTGVLPHTAIPEVNQAVNMMLKAGVRMGKINLGIGFYGRSFTLANPSCNVVDRIREPGYIAKKLDFVLKRAMPGVLIWATDLDINNNLLSSVLGKSLAQLPSSSDCPADGVWPRTEAGKKATVTCGSEGERGVDRALDPDGELRRAFSVGSHN